MTGSARGRWPRVGVSAAVVHRGHVLLVRRSRPPAAGAWAFPGGRLEYRESITDAVRREVWEETGIEVEPVELLDVVERRSGGDGLEVADGSDTRPGAKGRRADDQDGADAVDRADVGDGDAGAPPDTPSGYHWVILVWVARLRDPAEELPALRPGDDAMDARWVGSDGLDGLSVMDEVMPLARRALKGES